MSVAPPRACALLKNRRAWNPWPATGTSLVELAELNSVSVNGAISKSAKLLMKLLCDPMQESSRICSLAPAMIDPQDVISDAEVIAVGPFYTAANIAWPIRHSPDLNIEVDV